MVHMIYSSSCYLFSKPQEKCPGTCDSEQCDVIPLSCLSVISHINTYILILTSTFPNTFSDRDNERFDLMCWVDILFFPFASPSSLHIFPSTIFLLPLLCSILDNSSLFFHTPLQVSQTVRFANMNHLIHFTHS